MSIRKRFRAWRRRNQSPELKAQIFGDASAAQMSDPESYRADGTIREGDPAWGFMKMAMDGNITTASRNPDGTWDIQSFPMGEEKKDG